MKHLETKYRVADFAGTIEALGKLGARHVKTSRTTHYYASRPDTNVTKLVDYGERWQIHELEERGGSFAMLRRIDMPSREAGLNWLRDHGYDQVQVVTMLNEGYDIAEGEIGLYTINGWLTSVIVDVPAEHQADARQQLGLHVEDVIQVPYNLLLEQLGRAEFEALK